MKKYLFYAYNTRLKVMETEFGIKETDSPENVAFDLLHANANTEWEIRYFEIFKFDYLGRSLIKLENYEPKYYELIIDDYYVDFKEISLKDMEARSCSIYSDGCIDNSDLKKVPTMYNNLVYFDNKDDICKYILGKNINCNKKLGKNILAHIRGDKNE